MNYRHPTSSFCFNQLLKKLFAVILVLMLSLNPLRQTTAVQAAVTDNIGTAVVEQTVGSWDDTSEAHSVIGLLRLIIEKIVLHLEKLEALDAKVADLDEKLEQQTVSLKQSIDSSAQASGSSYSLYVFMPKTTALADYSGQQVTLSSPSGNQTATAILQDDGQNYSATLYYNFSGSCNLSYHLFAHDGQSFATLDYVTISHNCQEYQLADLTASPANMTWNTIHSILQANRAEEFGLTTAGTLLPGNWYVIGSGTNGEAGALRIWRKRSIQSAEWNVVNNTAKNFYKTFNTDTRIEMAYSSGLLSTSDVNSGWLAQGSNKVVPDATYWLLYTGSGYYGVSDAVYNYGSYTYSLGCCPYVWIN